MLSNNDIIHIVLKKNEPNKSIKTCCLNTINKSNKISFIFISNKDISFRFEYNQKLEVRNATLACEVYDSESENLAEPKSKKSKTEEKNDVIDDIVIKKPEKAEFKAKGEEDYAENLGCTICNEIMHDCIRFI